MLKNPTTHTQFEARPDRVTQMATRYVCDPCNLYVTREKYRLTAACCWLLVASRVCPDGNKKDFGLENL